MKSSITLLFACFAFSGIGQIVINELPVPVAGESIERFFDGTPDGVDITEAGVDQHWEWTLENAASQISDFEDNDRTDLFPDANIKLTQNALDDFYTMDATQWSLNGFNGSDPLGLGFNVTSFYIPALMEEYAPVAYQDSKTQSVEVYTGIPLAIIPDSLLELLPVIPDSLRLKVGIATIDYVDASGVLDINGKAVEVLRQRREVRTAIAVEAKVSILPWVDVTGLLEEFLPEGISLSDTSLVYRFLAPDYGFPVATVSIENDTIQIVEYQTETVTGTKDVVYQSADISIYPNPTSGEIYVSIPGSEQVTQIYVRDLTGRLIQTVIANGSESIIEIQFGDVPSGLYFLSLIDERGSLLGTGKVSYLGR